MQQFEFRAYRGDGEGDIAANPTVSFERLSGDAAAKAKAGRIAKKIGGPVDLAVAGGAEWDERYITTASPSEFHVSGYQLGRIE